MHCTSLSLRQGLHAAALAAALVLGSVATPQASLAAAPQVKAQAPGFYRMMLGDFEVTALSDGTVRLPVDKLLHEPAAKTQAALSASFLDAPPVETSVNAFLVNTGTKLVLIDAGAGGLFGPTLGKLVESLRAAGYRPEQVDEILITHMHPDHVGGLSASGATVFPNATVRADKRDADYWLSPQNMEKATGDAKGMFQGAIASLKPYVDAGRFQTFQGSATLVPGIRTLSSYGHTPGHASFLVESKGQKLIVLGDLIHVGAVQFEHPAVTIEFDTDKKAAAAVRAAIFAAAAKEGDLVGAAHISFPGLGHLRRAGKGWRWIPVNYTTELK
jgi:glyoxylase-like metal-dependent hydrolase (beta-lactamase superfamily II)